MVKAIAKTSDSIRKKHRALKTGKMVEDAALERHFRPIIEPLQKLVDNTTDDTSSPLIQTDEPMSNADDTESETLSPQREEIFQFLQILKYTCEAEEFHS
ncbi:hypothetical protein DMN91_003458 [Ooceraea biroi]|uniref:Uncharacterized protein n=1 Tax=Ooceraea biroi TaxID=2015173 RepID=A0A3L8DS41_OOCBI|nr:hypothetical protein DMN91_003458 [Ooceraea biroi]